MSNVPRRARLVAWILPGLIAIACAPGELPGDTKRGDATPVHLPTGPVECSAVDAETLSGFVVEPFQRDLAIDTPRQIAEHLDAHPTLICRTLHSDRYGDLSPIAYAAGHRPDAHGIFPMLVERGALASDALPVAVWRGDSRVVPWLLEHPVNPDTGAAIVLAAHQRNTRMVQRLLKAGADPSLPVATNPWVADDGRTALHWAARHGLREMIGSLLDAGADIDATDDLGRTPLSEAVLDKDAAIVKLLFDRGAEPNRMRNQDIDRLRAMARRYRLTEIAAYLS